MRAQGVVWNSHSRPQACWNRNHFCRCVFPDVLVSVISTATGRSSCIPTRAHGAVCVWQNCAALVAQQGWADYKTLRQNNCLWRSVLGRKFVGGCAMLLCTPQPHVYKRAIYSLTLLCFDVLPEMCFHSHYFWQLQRAVVLLSWYCQSASSASQGDYAVFGSLRFAM